MPSCVLSRWIYEWLVRILGWIIHLVPLAVFGVVAQVVGKSGVGVFSVLWIFLVAMLAGLTIHSSSITRWWLGSSGRNRRRSMSGRGRCDHDGHVVQQ